MSICTAFLDACVLYPAPVRDLLLQLAVADVYKARWSANVHREWMERLLHNEPHRKRIDLDRTRDLMDTATRDALVIGFEEIIPSLTLPDPNDRHVLAAAIAGECDVIVTANLKDFPDTALAPYEIEAMHPDDFCLNHLNLMPGLFCSCLRKVRQRLKKPPLTAEEHLNILMRCGLVATAAELRSVADFL